MTSQPGPGVSAPTAAQRRRERDRADARTAILLAARELAREEGWNALTMRRLADRIDYSANYAYRYFAGREEILLALARDGFARILVSMQEASGDLRPRDGLRRAGHAYLDFALAEPDLYQLMYGLGGVHVPTADTFNEGQQLGDLLAALLAQAGVDDADRKVIRLWATAHGLVALLGVGRVDPDAAALHSLLEDAMTDLLGPARSPSINGHPIK